MRGADVSVDQALEELYSTDPSDLTKKRDAIAKELKLEVTARPPRPCARAVGPRRSRGC